MAYLESGIFCSAAEYEKGLQRRVNGPELRMGDLYTMVMRLKSEKREASKLAVRALQVEQKVGLTVVQFAFVDHGMQPIHESEAQMVDGIMPQLQNTVVRDRKTQSAYQVGQAYLKDYFEDQFEGILVQSDQLSLTS